MICLLCFESSQDSIKIIGPEGKQYHISSLLYKYFRFCFDQEPCDGYLCGECWRKLLLFHEFYTRIETIYEQTNQNRFITTALGLKEENDVSEQNDSIQSSLKCEPVFSDDDDDDKGGIDSMDAVETPNTISDVKPTLKSPKQRQSLKTKKSSKKRKPFTKRPSRSLTFKCGIRPCTEDFATKDELIAHKINAHKRIQCTHCPDLKLVLDLNTHLKNMHGIIQTTICEQCGQEFQSNTTFLSHYKGVHEGQDPLQCDICKNWFKSRDSLRSHMTYVHIQGPQTCPICGKVSTNRKALLKHQKIHIESRKDRYKCIVCGRGFRDNTKLREHSYIHSGVTDAYSCNFCGKNFRFGSSLSAHRMKMHPMEMADVKYRLQWQKNVGVKM